MTSSRYALGSHSSAQNMKHQFVLHESSTSGRGMFPEPLCNPTTLMSAILGDILILVASLSFLRIIT